MKKPGLIILTILYAASWCVVAHASGEGAATLYNQGNALYAKGDFKGALRSYLHAQEQRVADPWLEQNIGSAYMKTGQLGWAIYHFERGFLLSPRDSDLKFNLDFAKSLRKDEIPDSGGFVGRIFSNAAANFTAEELIFTSTILFVIFFLILIIQRLVQGRARPVFYWVAAGFLILFLLISPFSAIRLYQEHITERGVVVGKEVKVLTAPGKGQAEAFVVHAGMPVKVLEKRGTWKRISIPSGLVGWVAENDAPTIGFAGR